VGGPTTQRSSLQFRDQFERAAGFFRDRPTLEGVLARRLLNVSDAGDESLADHLIRERRRRSRMDGSIDGALVPTARALSDLLDLGAPPDNAGVVRLAGYLLTRQNQPGRWSDDGRAGDGFFSPGPRATPIAPLTLHTGATFDEEADARFVASCLALRAVLRAGHDARAPVRTHLDRLLAIRVFDPHLAFVVVGALGLAPPEYHPRIADLLSSVGGRQQSDGTWPDVTIFHALDMLLGAPSASARALIRRAAPHVAALQHPSGAFDHGDSEALAVIALRALDAARTVG
jgi:hypothetical protein